MTFTIEILSSTAEPTPKLLFRQLDDQGIEELSAGCGWSDMSEVRDLVAVRNFYDAAIRMILERTIHADDATMKTNFEALVGPHVVTIT